MSPAAALRLLLLALPVALTAALCLAVQAPASITALAVGLAAFLPPALRLLRSEQQCATLAQRSEAFAQSLIDVIPHPVYVKDAASRYRMVNQAFLQDRGLERSAILGRSPRDLAQNNPADAARSIAEDQEVLAGRRIREERHDLHPRSGGERHRLIMKGRAQDIEGRPIVVGSNFDLSPWWILQTDLKATLQEERNLYKETLDFIQRVIDLIPYPVYVKDSTSRYTMVNVALAREMGSSVDALIGSMGVGNDTSPDALREMFEEDGQVLAGDVMFSERHGFREQDGREFFRVVSKGACADTEGEIVIVGTHVDLTELRCAERELKEIVSRETTLRERTQDFIQRLIDVIPDPMYIKRSGGRYVMVNDAFATYHGRTKEEVVGGGLNNATTSPETRALSLREDDRILAGAEVVKEEHTTRKLTGEEVFRIVCKRPSVYVDGDPVVVGIDHHITKHRVAERELKEVLEREVTLRVRTERFVQDLIDVMPDAIYIKNAESRYIMVNDAAARIRHMTKQQLVGLDSHDLAPRPEVGNTSVAEDQEVLAGKDIMKEERANLPVTGEECYRIIFKRRVINVDGNPVVVSIQHYITEWRLAERELKRLAQEDALTGIANRRYFTKEAERAMHSAERYGQPLSLLIVDVDHFKHINDQYGHNVGDEVLIELVQRTRDCLRKSDLPGRWGGEEFIVLLPHSDHAAAMLVAERLREAIAGTPFTTSAGPLSVTLSGGCARLQAGDSIETLVGRADEALYRAKKGGRNRILCETGAKDSPVAS